MSKIKVEVELCPTDIISEIPTEMIISELHSRNILLSSDDYKTLRNIFIQHGYDRTNQDLYQIILNNILKG